MTLLSDRLQDLRVASGLSVEEVADKSGVPASTLRDLERGQKCNPTLDTMWRLAEVYGVSLDFLAGRDADDKSR